MREDMKRVVLGEVSRVRREERREVARIPAAKYITGTSEVCFNYVRKRRVERA